MNEFSILIVEAQGATTIDELRAVLIKLLAILERVDEHQYLDGNQ